MIYYTFWGLLILSAGVLLILLMIYIYFQDKSVELAKALFDSFQDYQDIVQ